MTARLKSQKYVSQDSWYYDNPNRCDLPNLCLESDSSNARKIVVALVNAAFAGWWR
jgi:hypothetical protein